MHKAVILAAGLGTRMRRQDNASQLSADQSRFAAKGIKALIPVGRPFLDYVLSRLADAGYRHICLVIGPQHDELRHYYQHVARQRLEVDFAIQPEPLGTADAVAAAERLVQQDPFLVINSDNYYPTDVLRAIREVGGSATAGFDRRGLLLGNIPAERVARYAILTPAPDGTLERIVEKPDPAWVETLPDPVLVSMNCWRFEASIFEACRCINPSPRGEYEIPDAVFYSMQHHDERFRIVPSEQPVLDMTGPEDIESVKSLLADEEVNL